MIDSVFTKRLYNFVTLDEPESHVCASEIFVEISSKATPQGTKDRRVLQLLEFIRTYVPKDVLRDQSLELRNAAKSYLIEMDIDLRKKRGRFLKNFINTFPNIEFCIQEIIGIVKEINTDEAMTHAITLLIEIGDSLKPFAKTIASFEKYDENIAYAVSFATGSYDNGFLETLSHSPNKVVREAVVDVIEFGIKNETRVTQAILKRLAIGEKDEDIMLSAQNILNFYGNRKIEVSKKYGI